MTEDEKVGWHHWLNGLESEQSQGDGEGQGGRHAAVHGVSKSWTRLSDWATTWGLCDSQLSLVKWSLSVSIFLVSPKMAKSWLFWVTVAAIFLTTCFKRSTTVPLWGLVRVNLNQGSWNRNPWELDHATEFWTKKKWNSTCSSLSPSKNTNISQKIEEVNFPTLPCVQFYI